jgi:hypothetical protein
MQNRGLKEEKIFEAVQNSNDDADGINSEKTVVKEGGREL